MLYPLRQESIYIDLPMCGGFEDALARLPNLKVVTIQIPPRFDSNWLLLAQSKSINRINLLPSNDGGATEEFFMKSREHPEFHKMLHLAR